MHDRYRSRREPDFTRKRCGQNRYHPDLLQLNRELDRGTAHHIRDRDYSRRDSLDKIKTCPFAGQPASNNEPNSAKPKLGTAW